MTGTNGLSRDQLRDELTNAPKAPGQKADGRAGGKGRAAPSGGGDRGKVRGSSGRVLDGCPVTPLGVRGDHAFFLDALGQLRSAKDLKLQVIASLFAADFEYLCNNFPRWRGGADAPERVPGQFDGTVASYNLWRAAGECGVFNPDNAVRGVGAWTDDDGQLVYHMGDAILYQGETLPPGRIEVRIYPAAPALPRPADGGPDPVPAIMETLESWNWADADLHPYVALGMICAQMVCGALRWRPTFWLTAPAGAGKSAFQEMLNLLHGDGALVQSTDATKSGITSRLKHSSLPVAIDELEPEDERSNRGKSIIELARVASSGGEWSRGSADQSAVGGKVYSSFFFSSILIPGVLSSQDVQRLIRLDMRRIDNARGLSLVPKTWRARGARLKGLLIARWASLPERVALWRHALEIQGVKGRDADNWEIVLALASMAEAEDLPDAAQCESWARKVALQVASHREDVTNDADAMLAHLLGQPLDPFRRGEMFTVAQWIMAAGSLPGAPKSLLPELAPEDFSQRDDRARKANDLIGQYGLRVYKEEEPVLFIANKSGPANLARLFERTQWAGGAWEQSAARVPNAYKPRTPRSLAGNQTRGTMIPLRSIPSLMAFPEDKAKPPHATAQGDEIEDYGKDFQ